VTALGLAIVLLGETVKIKQAAPYAFTLTVISAPGGSASDHGPIAAGDDCSLSCVRVGLFRRNDYLDCSIGSEMVVIRSMMLGIPVSNASPYFAQKVKTALLGQMSQIADQICDRMFVASAAMRLKNCDCVSGPRNMVSVIHHPSLSPVSSLTRSIYA
jgi:hypothetical protein